MERVWRRVQGAGRRGAAAARCGCPVQPCQLHVDQRAKRGGGGRKSRGGGPQTIVCGCQVQPCPVHPVLIRIRRTRPAATSATAAAAVTSCDCPPDSQPCPHVQRGSAARRIRRSECNDRSCRHTSCGAGTRRRAVAQSSSSPVSSQSKLQQAQQQPCECTDERLNCSHTGGGEAPCECECGEEAKPCPHTAKTRSVRRTCTDCSCTQPCGHKPQSEGRIKRVKCRVRRAGCAMARCTAELAMLHLHWELAAECAPCRPRALTRRLCRRQQSDNELYRSNSFKFERFERTKDECVTPLRKQVPKGVISFYGILRLVIPRSKSWGAARDQSHCKNNGGVVCIDESLPSTLCRFNVIPVTSATTTGTESGFQHHFGGEGWMVLQLLMEALSYAASRCRRRRRGYNLRPFI